MALNPQTEPSSTLTLDISDNQDLREIFSSKEVGHKCKLTFELQVMQKDPQKVVLAIEKVIADPSEYYKNEAKASKDEPIMARMMNRKKMDGEKMGPHGRPPQTAENSQEPWMTSYV